MIKIDYSLNIKKEEKVYKPLPNIVEKISKSSNKIFEIIGSNSYGKTFILNLIAGALHGEKLSDNQILGTLKERLDRYSNESYCDLSYNIELPLGKKDVLNLTKKSGEQKLIQLNDGPPLGERILDDIDLIYDVPLNPQERLELVIKDIAHWNTTLQEKSSHYNGILRKLRTENSEIRDDAKIKELERNQKTKEERQERTKQRLAETKKQLDDALLIEKLQKLKETYSELHKKETKLKKLLRELKNTPKPKKQTIRDENLIESLREDINNLTQQFKSHISKLNEEITGIDDLQTRIENNCYKAFESIQSKTLEQFWSSNDPSEEQKKFISDIDSITHEINQFIYNEERDEKYATVDFLVKLKNEISEYTQSAKSSADSLLEKLTTKKQDGLIEFINEQINAIQIHDFDELKKITRNYTLITRDIIATGHKKQRELLEAQNIKTVIGNGNKYYELDGQITNLKSDIKTTNEEKIICLNQCADLAKLNRKRLDTLSKVNDYLNTIAKNLPSGISKSIHAEINSKRSLHDKIKKELEELTIEINLIEIKLEQEKNKKEGVYNEKQLKKIEDFRKSMQMLTTNMVEFQKILKSNKTTNLEAEDLEYQEVLGKVIAYSMDNKILMQDGKFQKLISYNTITKEFTYFDEEKDKELQRHKDDVSTGLASANYLIQKINNISKDQAIILLDEIGNMDEDSLGKVIHACQNLNKQGRLVLALLTKPENKKPYIKEY